MSPEGGGRSEKVTNRFFTGLFKKGLLDTQKTKTNTRGEKERGRLKGSDELTCET